MGSEGTIALEKWIFFVASCYEQTRYIRLLGNNWGNLYIDWGIFSLNKCDIGTVVM